MLEIALFGEDYAHRQIVGALTRRVSAEVGVAVAAGLAERRAGPRPG